MHSAILLWQIRPSVCAVPVLCLNECTYLHIVDDLLGTSSQLLSPNAVTKFQGEPPEVVEEYMYCTDIAFISRTLR